MSQDEQSRTPLAVSVIELCKIMQKQDQTVFIFDCNYAGLLVKQLSRLLQTDAYNMIAFGACLSNQRLPYMSRT